MIATVVGMLVGAIIGVTNGIVNMGETAIADSRTGIAAAPKVYSTCPSVGWALFVPGDHAVAEINRAVPGNRGVTTCTHEFTHVLRGRVSGALVALPVQSYGEAVAIARKASESLKTDNVLIIFMGDGMSG